MNIFNPALPLTATIKQIQNLVPPEQYIYLVGGAVRDALVGKITHDFDFVLPDNVTQIGRLIANAFDGAFYILDKTRETVRAIIRAPDGTRQILDFSTQRGTSLQDDLSQRDFTINAIAVDLHNPAQIIDPLGGAQDLIEHTLRACSPRAFSDDPLRIMRAVRLAVTYNLVIPADTRNLISASLEGLNQISPERIRDELFRILSEKRVTSALRILDMLGALSIILPEIPLLKDIQQSPPHIYDVYNHSLQTIQKLSEILAVISQGSKTEKSENWMYGYISLRLGRYRYQLHSHLEEQLNPERNIRSLIFFAALFHDCGKSFSRDYDEFHRLQFHEHDRLGAELVHKRALNLRLNNSEIERLVSILRNHRWPFYLTQAGELPSNRTIFCFFHDTGPSGIDICLISLADLIATYEHALPQELWIRHIDTIHSLFEAWWEKREQTVSPPSLVSGNELIRELNICPGPRIGILLAEIQESQAAGEISNSNEAIEYARKRLKQL